MASIIGAEIRSIGQLEQRIRVIANVASLFQETDQSILKWRINQACIGLILRRRQVIVGMRRQGGIVSYVGDGTG
jgi:hypothetical protein